MTTWMRWILCAAIVLPAAAALAQKSTTETTTQKKTTETTETAAGQDHDGEGRHRDRKFLDKAAMGGLAEVKLGQLAVDKGESPTVKEFGKRMVDDHGKANDELKEIASKKNMPMPTSMSPQQQATYDKLSKLSGAQFDKAYMDAMVKDHDKDVKEFKKETADGGLDPDLKAWAQKTLNVIEEHDHIAHQDKSALKKP